jgi:hypothetical protein
MLFGVGARFKSITGYLLRMQTVLPGTLKAERIPLAVGKAAEYLPYRLLWTRFSHCGMSKSRPVADGAFSHNDGYYLSWKVRKMTAITTLLNYGGAVDSILCGATVAGSAYISIRTRVQMLRRAREDSCRTPDGELLSQVPNLTNTPSVLNVKDNGQRKAFVAAPCQAVRRRFVKALVMDVKWGKNDVAIRK